MKSQSTFKYNNSRWRREGLTSLVLALFVIVLAACAPAATPPPNPTAPPAAATPQAPGAIDKTEELPAPGPVAE